MEHYRQAPDGYELFLDGVPIARMRAVALLIEVRTLTLVTHGVPHDVLREHAALCAVTGPDSVRGRPAAFVVHVCRPAVELLNRAIADPHALRALLWLSGRDAAHVRGPEEEGLHRGAGTSVDHQRHAEALTAELLGRLARVPRPPGPR